LRPGLNLAQEPAVTRSPRAIRFLPALLLLAAAPGGAVSLTPNNTADLLADDGVCTLRESILAANLNMASGRQRR
jgi:hypothetical protein